MSEDLIFCLAMLGLAIALIAGLGFASYIQRRNLPGI